VTSTELSRLIVRWTDALTLAEVTANPFLRVGKEWDLHDWQAEEIPEGLRFQHLDALGRTIASVIVVPPESADESAPPRAVCVEADRSDVFPERIPQIAVERTLQTA